MEHWKGDGELSKNTELCLALCILHSAPEICPFPQPISVYCLPLGSVLGSGRYQPAEKHFHRAISLILRLWPVPVPSPHLRCSQYPRLRGTDPCPVSTVGFRRRVGWEKLEIRSHKEFSFFSLYILCLSHFILCEGCSLPPLYSMIPKTVSLAWTSRAPCCLTAQKSYRHHELKTRSCLLTGPLLLGKKQLISGTY